MVTIDLIIPSIISYQQYPQFKKFEKIQIFQDFAFPSWNGNWFPIWYNKKRLEKEGIKVRFINYLKINQKKLSNIVGFDSRILNNLIHKYEYIRETIQKEIIPLLKKIKRDSCYIIYFDNGDNPGYIHDDIIPYVDRYLKKQIYKDRSNYLKSLYRKRLFTDFYARHYNLVLNDEHASKCKINNSDLQKIGLSWNFAFKDYRYSNYLSRLFYGCVRKNNIKFCTPETNRKYLLSANYSINRTSELVYYQRTELLKFLKQKYKDNPNVVLGKIPKKQYIKTINSSKTIISPFGWGEICYRDFETFIAGAALIKPDIEHLDTWPNIFKTYETYIPISWKIEEWDRIFSKILDDERLLLKTAINGQNAFKRLLSTNGNEIFCERFKNIFLSK